VNESKRIEHFQKHHPDLNPEKYPGGCPGGCTFTREEYPKLFEALSAWVKYPDAEFTVPEISPG
jgi:hypothetical protein